MPYRYTTAPPWMVDDEMQLWRSGVLNTTTSKGLSYAVFFYNCKTSGLRGNTEHRNLDASQFVLRCDDTGENYVQFYSWNSKIFQGGLDQRRMQPRVVKQYAVKNDNNLCVYDVFATYLKMIPSSGPFYHPENCLHDLLPPKRDPSVSLRLRHPTVYPIPQVRTNRYCSFINYALKKYQWSLFLWLLLHHFIYFIFRRITLYFLCSDIPLY